MEKKAHSLGIEAHQKKQQRAKEPNNFFLLALRKHIL